MPTHDFKNIGDVLDFELLRGTIKTVDSATDTCTVDVDGSTVDALIFYHCKPDSIARASGAIEGAAGGFKVGDEVIVLKKYDGSAIKVIAHTDGVHRCGGEEYVVITASFASMAESATMVWKCSENKIEINPCPSTDSAYLEWLSKKTDTGSNLYSESVKCGTQTPWINLPAGYSQPSGCQLLIPGGVDTGSESGDGSNGSATNDWQALGPNIPGNTMPESVYALVVMPDSPTEVVGLRTRSQMSSSWVTDSETDIYIRNRTRSLTFYGPFGILNQFAGAEVYKSHPVWGILFDYQSMIPEWPALIDPEWSDNKKYARGRVWYGSDISGQYTDRTIANLLMVHYTPCEYQYEKSFIPITIPEDGGLPEGGGYVEAESWSFSSSRTVAVQAQIIYNPEGIGATDWVSEGRNATLEAAIVDLVELAYELNSVPVNEIRDLRVQMTIKQ
jgi:hypothetical protein